MKQNQLPAAHYRPASIGRHLAACCYDGLIIFSLLFVGTAMIMPFNDGAQVDSHSRLYASYLVLLWGGYFCYFMSNGRQTIGMKAWKLTCQQFDGKPLSPAQAIIRFGFAIPCISLFAMGILWKLVDRKGIGLHERWSKSLLTQKIT